MRKVIILLLLSMCSILQACSSNDEYTEPEKFLFKDDFDSFDENTWTKEAREAGWVNNELQAYDPTYVSVGMDEGKSVLILTAERKGNKIFSGRVNSQGKKSFKYGRIEASIKLPKTADGLWPAFWLMGDNDKHWPQCGEIDIMEMGERNGIASGTSETFVNTAIHYGDNVETHRQEFHAANVANSLQDGKYHTYTLDWDNNRLTITIDNVKFHSFDISKISGRSEYFQDNFYILFNLAVGGDFPAIHNINDITALKDGEKVHMYIDWVKVY